MGRTDNKDLAVMIFQAAIEDHQKQLKLEQDFGLLPYTHVKNVMLRYFREQGGLSMMIWEEIIECVLESLGWEPGTMVVIDREGDVSANHGT